MLGFRFQGSLNSCNIVLPDSVPRSGIGYIPQEDLKKMLVVVYALTVSRRSPAGIERLLFFLGD